MILALLTMAAIVVWVAYNTARLWMEPDVTPLDESAGWFGDFSDEARKPEPLDWATFPEWREIARRRPESFVPEHIERRRAA